MSGRERPRCYIIDNYILLKCCALAIGYNGQLMMC